MLPPEDLWQHPGHLIRRAVQVLNTVWAEEVSKTVTSPQFAVLNALLREPGLGQQALGSRVALDRSTVAEVVARLTERQLVRWRRDAADGRRKVIELTPRGEALLQELIPRTHRMTRRLVQGLRAGEEADLLRLLTILVRSHEYPPD
ncbi:MAG: MarR family transcriptional regulator [Chloroflexi bacterium]|nr:MAG: MarR family transcriptional regulator [Chloroflexota bacterium]